MCFSVGHCWSQKKSSKRHTPNLSQQRPGKHLVVPHKTLHRVCSRCPATTVENLWDHPCDVKQGERNPSMMLILCFNCQISPTVLVQSCSSLFSNTGPNSTTVLCCINPGLILCYKPSKLEVSLAPTVFPKRFECESSLLRWMFQKTQRQGPYPDRPLTTSLVAKLLPPPSMCETDSLLPHHHKMINH